MAINILLKKKSDERDDTLFPTTERENCPETWFSEHEEGQLAVDVFETEKEIVLRTAIAGVTQDDLDVFLHNDMLTVRGVRHANTEPGSRYMVRECHWGPFSRSVILPTDIDPDGISAALRDGVLTIRMPKVERSRHISVSEF